MNTESEDSGLLVILVIFALAFIGIPALYAVKASIVNGFLIKLCEIQLKPFALFSSEARTALSYVAGLDPAGVQWEQMSKVLYYTGAWLRWPFCFLLGCLALVSCHLSRTDRLTRRFDMTSLTRNNAEIFPCLFPIVGRGDALLSPDSYDSGLWRIARSPIQFAVEHSLLVNTEGQPFAPEQVLKGGIPYADLSAFGHAQFDRDKAMTVLQAQLGGAASNFAALTPIRQVLVAAFLSYAAGDKDTCIQMLDTLSRSYVEKNGQASVTILLESSEEGATEWLQFRNDVFSVHEKHQAILREPLLLRHTTFELPWFMALLTRARQKGVLATSQFLWLRPLDRPLWYALNQCGGRVAWPEALAAWAHFTAEEQAVKTLPDFDPADAVQSLENELATQGWFCKAEDTPPAEAPAKGEEQCADRNWISPKDPDIVEYDADNDPELFKECI